MTSKEGHHHDTCGCGHDHDHHHHDTCGCGHNHTHDGHSHMQEDHGQMEREESVVMPENVKKQVYILENLGCANCAAKMERQIRNLYLCDKTAGCCSG